MSNQRVGLTHAAPFARETPLHSKGGLPRQHVRDGSAQCLCQEAPGVALPLGALHAGQKLWARLGVTAQQSGRFGKGPREMGVADFCTRGAPAVPPGLGLCTCERRVELLTPESLSPYIGPYILREMTYVSFNDTVFPERPQGAV